MVCNIYMLNFFNYLLNNIEHCLRMSIYSLNSQYILWIKDIKKKYSKNNYKGYNKLHIIVLLFSKNSKTYYK